MPTILSESGDYSRITELDRADAVENIVHAIGDLSAELQIIAALDEHQLNYAGSKNLGYYRTFIECSCGAGWWFGGHEDDPSAADRWAIHRARILRQVLSLGGH